MQSGSRMVTETEKGYEVGLNEALGDEARQPLSAALQFFVEFSNANSQLYSWNRSKENDLSSFLGEELAIYFGYGSEAFRIRERNPNFNFDVTAIPQGAGATVKRIYGQFYGLAIVKASDNPQGTFRALQRLSDQASVAGMSEALQMAPVHRSTVAAGAQNPYRQTFLYSALIARGWLDPAPSDSSDIFQQMVEDVVSNRQKVSGAVSDAVKRLELAF